ncbi:MAG TPA: hypothetical protein VJZ49_10395 [Syntrophales bacterium]|nr:hypothetical protein [Syntrophales bacterium]
MNIFESLLLVCAVCGIFHSLYFLLAPFIWSQNLPVNPQAIAPWIRPWTDQHDGIEIYALYALMFACLAASQAAAWFWNRVTGRAAYSVLVLLLVAAAYRYLVTIGFHPPVHTLAARSILLIFKQSAQTACIIVPMTIFLLALQKRVKECWVNTAVLTLLVPICFIAVQPISWKDYSFALAPALRLLHGAGLSEIYFQYDPLLSLPALAWIKLKLDLNLFQAVGQASYLLYIFSIFLLARKLYSDNKLPFFFLISLVLIRMYATFDDPVRSFQVTPLRLDWWLLFLALVYRWGPYHWSAGLFCGLMILVHKNFGVIYTLAYFQLLFTLFIIDGFQGEGRTSLGTWRALLTHASGKLSLNLAAIAAAGVASILLFNGVYSDSVYYYQKIGIGFIRIARDSFYWYALVVICLSFILCLRLRGALPRKYLTACLLLIYLAIGNSIYFFGRSHEHNILHISGPLLLLFFLLLDLTKYLTGEGNDNPAAQFAKRNLTLILSVLFVLLIIVSYGDRITGKAVLQARNATNLQLHYPSLRQDMISGYLKKFRALTGNSEKVYFACRYIDVIFYYYGGYAPVGYFNPFTSWIFTKDLEWFLQDLLDKGYFIVVGSEDSKEALSRLAYNKTGIIDNFVILWK